MEEQKITASVEERIVNGYEDFYCILITYYQAQAVSVLAEAKFTGPDSIKHWLDNIKKESDKALLTGIFKQIRILSRAEYLGEKADKSKREEEETKRKEEEAKCEETRLKNEAAALDIRIKKRMAVDLKFTVRVSIIMHRTVL